MRSGARVGMLLFPRVDHTADGMVLDSSVASLAGGADGNIAEGTGGLWLAGVIPVVGWLVNIISYDLWTTNFGLMTALWAICMGIVLMLRNVQRG